MGAEVLSFQKAKEDREPRVVGPARCMLCAREWEASVPLGTIWLECPSCGSDKGHLVGNIASHTETHFVCNCGNALFTVCGDGAILCPNCGEYHGETDILDE